MSKILLLGPTLNKKNPEKIGGIIVLFEDLIQQLDKNNIPYQIIDTNKDNYSSKISAFILIYYKFLINFTKFSHISIHGTAKDYLYIAPFVILVSKIFNKKTILRKFAGNFNKIYENYNFIYKTLINFCLSNSNINFFETKELVNYFKNFNQNTFWFPNVRNIEQKRYKKKDFTKKFVFISTVKRTKGIHEIINAFKELPKEYSVDIFGPIQENDLNKLFLNSKNVAYKGVLKSSKVISTLENYDVLLLPTYHSGEGYPGIIIEAFALAIPSISTYWNSIPELINNNHNGLLVEPKNYLDLKYKILNIDIKYEILSKNAYTSFSKFSSKEQTRLFLEKIGF